MLCLDFSIQSTKTRIFWSQTAQAPWTQLQVIEYLICKSEHSCRYWTFLGYYPILDFRRHLCSQLDCRMRTVRRCWSLTGIWERLPSIK
jgi:hypothetical protein